MKEFLDYFEYARAYIIIALGIIVLTFIMYLLFKDKKFIKYIPGIVLLVVGVIGLISLLSANTLSKGITSMMIFIVGVGGGVIGLFTSLLIAVYTKEGKSPKAKSSY